MLITQCNATNATTTETMHTNATNATTTETMHTNATNATTTETMHTNATTTETMQTVEYDFENDDDSFYDFIEFGIASNRGQLCIKRRV